MRFPCPVEIPPSEVADQPVVDLPGRDRAAVVPDRRPEDATSAVERPPTAATAGRQSVLAFHGLGGACLHLPAPGGRTAEPRSGIHPRAGRSRIVVGNHARVHVAGPGDGRSDPAVGSVARGVRHLLQEDRSAALREWDQAASSVAATGPWSVSGWSGLWALLRAVEGRDEVDAIALAASRAPSRDDAAALDLARAVLVGRAGAPTRAAALLTGPGAREERWGWHRFLGRRLAAETALRDGWGDPLTWLAEAAAFFEGLAAPAVAAAARALAAGTAPAPPTAQRPPSPRELEVLDLVAHGMTNGQIGRSLRISPRTVEKHVQALCHKLGVDGRGRLIALAARTR